MREQGRFSAESALKRGYSVVKSLSVSESDCAAIVDSLPEERPSSVSAPKTPRNEM